MRVGLAGVLEIAGADGKICRIRSTKGRVLIALLATANGMKRSREWLRALLWERVSERSSSDSLRQELFKLRENLGDLSSCLQADPVAVWLENAVLDMEGGPSAVVSFFEDAPTMLGEEFDDWLRLERDRFDDMRARDDEDRSAPAASTPSPRPAAQVASIPVLPDPPAPPSPVLHRSIRPCVALTPPISRCTNMRADVLAAFATEQICEVFRLNGMVDVFDLCDMQSDQLSGIGEVATQASQAIITASLTEIGDMLSFSIAAREQATRRVLWNSSITINQTGNDLLSPGQVSEFVTLAVESIEQLVCRAYDTRGAATDGPPALYAMVHQLFSVSKQGAASARKMLRAIDDAEPDPLTAAWLAFSNVFEIGENFGERDAVTEETEAWAFRALEREPSNPLALALVSHVLAYVLDERALARELVDRSRRLAPSLAFAADFSALQHLYEGDLDKGMAEAKAARRLGRFSPYRFWFDSTEAIGATMTGDHARAVDVSRSVLRTRPGFLAVMRHACASLAELGQYDDATRLFEEIRAVDADFGSRAMRDRTYPLPSRCSVDTIMNALSKIRRIE